MYVPHCATSHRVFPSWDTAIGFLPPTQNRRYVYATDYGWQVSWSTHLLVLTRGGDDA